MFDRPVIAVRLLNHLKGTVADGEMMGIAEKRRETRLPLPECIVSGSRGGSGRVLDVSSAGLGVVVTRQCTFARGELHRLVLSDPSHSVEVEGTVCWTQSNWRNHRGSHQNEYFQTAGLTLSSLLTKQPGGIWTSLMANVPIVSATLELAEVSAAETLPEPVPEPAPIVDAVIPKIETPPETRKRPAPPLRMIEPLDGSVVSQDAVNVICIIENSRAVTSLKINGFEAILMEDMGTASVKLDRGMNRILSSVRKLDGSYSSYLLGTIERAVGR